MPPKPYSRLGKRDERVAAAITNPGNLAEIALGMALYPKQKQALRLCIPKGSCVSIAAANGTGKTSHLIPALVAWHMYLWPAGRIKITSGSWPQIETQIWPAIEEKVKPQFPHFKWLETPKATFFDKDSNKEGMLHCFTTNNPGFAEGAHADGDEAPLLYIVDEAKTCPPWLRQVVTARVRPTRLVLMSSHGFMEGWFYESQTLLKDKFRTIQIRAEDCEHITPEEIKSVRDEWFAYPEFADAVLGWGFMPLVENSVINGPALENCMANPPDEKPGEVHAACDFAWSGAGDENVLAMRVGNKIKLEACFRCGHLESSKKNPEPGIVETFISHFVRLGLRMEQISGDDAGGGKLVMDALEGRGWYLNRINNGATANNDEAYANIGAEMWYEASKQITSRWPVIENDRTLRSQLLNRKRVKGSKGRLAIESKDDMRKRGVQSPDRADAYCMACLPSGGLGPIPISNAISAQMGSFHGCSEVKQSPEEAMSEEMRQYQEEMERERLAEEELGRT